MRYSKFFGRTMLTAPHDADSINARLLTQAGFIDKLGAGIYSLLPLAQRVLHKINKIIREEMDALGAQELLMPALHPLEIWEVTGRHRDLAEILFTTKGAGDKEFVFGPTHEETVTPLAKKQIKSYKDLPMAVYQIQTKFRNEPRAKSGLLRGREFGMKDLYSFHTDEDDLDLFYEKAKEAYLRVYKRMGLTAYVVEASGGTFTKKFSHEFSVVTHAGEDRIMICEKCLTARNSELLEDKKADLKCAKCHGDLKEERAIEIGNIFKLGTKFSQDFEMYYADENGKRNLVTMGCYGIGNTRLIGTIAEICHDEKGIVWPKTVAPYHVYLIQLGVENEVASTAEKLYKQLLKESVEVLFDDRDESAGKKFHDADLIGIPLRIVISNRTLKEASAEWKLRTAKEGKLVSLKNLSLEITKFLHS